MKLRSCFLIIIILIGGYFGLALVFSYLDSRSINSFDVGNDDAIAKLTEQAMTGRSAQTAEESSETNSEPDATVNNSPPEESEPTPEPETSPEPDSESPPETDPQPTDDPATDADESDGAADNDAERAAAEAAARRAAEEEAAREATERAAAEEAAREAAERAAEEAAEAAAAQAAEELFMNFYIHTANYFNINGGRYDVRWNQNTVYVQVVETSGSLSDGEAQSLAHYISEFNANSNSVKLQRRDSSAGNIVLEVFNREDAQWMCSGDDGCAIAHANGSCVITSANVYLAEENGNNGISTTLANYLVHHEMHHAMGYWHADEYSTSLMGVAHADATYPNAVDLRAIRMLYNSGVPVCQNEAQTRAYFAEHPTP